MKQKQGEEESPFKLKDACYHKVKARYEKKGNWPSAYGSGALVQCRNKGAANWGNKSKKKKKPSKNKFNKNLFFTP